MTFYLDTSVLVSAFTHESATDRVQNWLRNAGRDIIISEWVAVEFASAISLKMRTGELTEAYRGRANTLFARMASESVTSVFSTTEHFRAAARFTGDYRLGLRAPDALHLAIAADYGATIVTRDRQLYEAGKALGVRAHLL